MFSSGLAGEGGVFSFWLWREAKGIVLAYYSVNYFIWGKGKAKIGILLLFDDFFNFQQYGTWKIKMDGRAFNNVCVVIDVSNVFLAGTRNLEFSPRVLIPYIVLLIEERPKRSSYQMRK